MANLNQAAKALMSSRSSMPKGTIAYDNPRENIDPHIKTKVLNTKEFIFDKVEIDLWLGAGGIRGAGLKPATFLEYGLSGVWQFANQALAANQENVSGTLKIPSDMDRTAQPLFKIGWSADGISPGNAYWQLEYLWVGLNEATNAIAQATIKVDSTASTTSNGLTIAVFPALELPSATDQALLFQITRLSEDALDTIAGTIEMRGRLFTYTKDKLGKVI